MRTIVSTGTAALGVVLLLTGLAMGPAAEGREARAALRSPLSGAGSSGSDGLLYRSVDDYYRGDRVTANEVAVTGRTELRPAGVERLPGPGELVVSPAMARLVDDPGTTMGLRYPGRVVGFVQPEGLVGPEELVVWSGRSPEQLPPDTIRVLNFSRLGADGTEVPAELGPAQALLVVGFLIPLLALLATAATIGGAQRDERLSALRLLGLTSTQVKWSAATEAGLTGLVALALGSGAFFVLRGSLAPHVPVTGGVWPQDAAPGPVALTAVALVVPVLAALTSLLSLRGVSVNPLAVVRRSAAPAPTNWRCIPLTLGAALLVVASVHPGSRLDGVDARGQVLVVAVGLCTVGLLTGSAVVNRLIAVGLERLNVPLAAGIALRRVTTAAARTSRVVTGLACLVFVSGILVSFFPLLADAAAPSLRALAPAAGPGTFMAGVSEGVSVDVPALRRSPGVKGAVILRQVPVRSPDQPEMTSYVVVAECDALLSVVPAVGDCSRGLVVGSRGGEGLHINPGQDLQPYALREEPDGTQVPRDTGARFRTSVDPVSSAIAAVLLDATSMAAPVVVPQQQFPAGIDLATAQGTLLVRHDGADVEALRTQIRQALNGAETLTLAEQLAIADHTTRTFRGLTLVAFLCAALVAALSLLVALVEQVREQRRAMLFLWVCGTPRSTLRAALVLQTVTVTVPALAIAFGLSALAATVFLGLADVPPPLPWEQMAVVLGGALVVPLVASLAILPLLRPQSRPVLQLP